MTLATDLVKAIENLGGRSMLPKEIEEAKEKADAIYEKIQAGTYAGEGRLF